MIFIRIVIKLQGGMEFHRKVNRTWIRSTSSTPGHWRWKRRSRTWSGRGPRGDGAIGNQLTNLHEVEAILWLIEIYCGGFRCRLNTSIHPRFADFWMYFHSWPLVVKVSEWCLPLAHIASSEANLHATYQFNYFWRILSRIQIKINFFFKLKIEKLSNYLNRVA